MERNLITFSEQLLKLTQENIAFVVVTLTSFRGSAPQEIGARMIVGHEGILFGTVGGGKIENRCLETCHEILKSEKKVEPHSYTWNLQTEIGMSCGGEVSMLFEAHRPQERWKIAVFGAGHVSQELVRILMKLDCDLTVTDTRSEWLEKLPSGPRLKKQHRTEMSAVIDELTPDTFVVLVTMGHTTDYPILLKCLKEKNFPYLGVIGSDTKRKKLDRELETAGVKAQLLTKYFCPIGENFGTSAPAEIALSITAQLLRIRDQIYKGDK
ncbi:MAG: xanthine dehydrogenase accessory protein XdhC [Bacteriovoracaceae bacterium]|nr:xanthine dehydrogenase accessory protein XdhC [Bacteriovoracaceae bacterium]